MKKYIDLIKTIVFKLIFFVFSFIVPKDKRLLVFQSLNGIKLRDEPKYAYLYAKNNLKDYKLMYFLSEREDKEYTLFGIKKHKINLRNAWYILRARYIFVETTSFKKINLSSLIGNFNLILLWHGALGQKNETFIKKSDSIIVKLFGKFEYGKFKHIVVPFDESKHDAAQIFHNKNIVRLSPLRTSILFNKKDFSVEKLQSKFKMNRYDKVILYAPTWRVRGERLQPISAKVLLKLNTLFKKKNYVMYVLNHPQTKEIPISKNLSNIKNVWGKVIDIYEMFTCADMLITDYSTSIVGFSLTEKPMVFYLYDLEYYKKMRGIDMDYKKEALGPIIYSDHELLSFFKKRDSFSNKKYLQKIRKFKCKINKNVKGDSCKILFKLLKLK
jgi:CDP-glycerol glycerophosphotransferase